MKKRTRLTTLGWVVVLGALLTGGALVGAAGASAMRPGGQAHRCVLVQPGDTLWDIARSAEPDKDPRQVVGRIVAHNGLVTTRIDPGTALWVPWDGSGSAGSFQDCPVSG